jgi:hypothetical protein
MAMEGEDGEEEDMGFDFEEVTIILNTYIFRSFNIYVFNNILYY